MIYLSGSDEIDLKSLVTHNPVKVLHHRYSSALKESQLIRLPAKPHFVNRYPKPSFHFGAKLGPAPHRKLPLLPSIEHSSKLNGKPVTPATSVPLRSSRWLGSGPGPGVPPGVPRRPRTRARVTGTAVSFSWRHLQNKDNNSTLNWTTRNSHRNSNEWT